MGYKGQSAIEFLTAYSTAFLIIAIMLAALFIFVSLPFTSMPFSCNPYSDFTCQDAVLSSNGTGGMVLLLELSDAVPGVMNISNFSSTLNGVRSRSGYCAPNLTASGERVYCIADFNGAPQLGSLYSGTFDIYANFCTGGPGELALGCASGGGAYAYGGSIRIEGAGNVSSPSVWRSQITLDNTQGYATPANFQQMVSFNPASANAPLHERQDLGNIRFYYGSQELYAWCESNCSRSSPRNATFWIRIPQGIQARQSITIQMYLMPTSVDYTGRYAGEAPQLSSPYGGYDNGDEVFLFYQNFQGTSIPTGWAKTGTGITVSVNNGITVSPGGANALGSLTSPSSYNGTLDFYGQFFGSGDSSTCTYNTARFGFDNASLGYATPQNIGCQKPQPFGLITNSSSGGYLKTFAYTQGANSILSVAYSAPSNSFVAQVGYVSAASSNSFVSSLPLPIGFYQQSDSGVSISAAWVRLRASAPGGIMPAQTVGPLVQAR